MPELTVTDVAASLRFYVAGGFTVRFRRSEPDFAYIELGHAQLMLEQEHVSGWNINPLDRPLGRGVNIQIRVPNAQVTVGSLKQSGYFLYQEPQETWYAVNELQEVGQVALLAQDPDGYLIRFAEMLGTRAK